MIIRAIWIESMPMFMKVKMNFLLFFTSINVITYV